MFFTHQDPDLDGLGATIALHLALRNLNKDSLVFLTQPLPDFFKPLVSATEFKNDLPTTSPDLIIGLDYGNIKRLELCQKYQSLATDWLTFDHHALGQHQGLTINNPLAASTSEIIYQFLEFLDQPITRVIATCLLAGIFDDTGGFCHAATSAQTLKIAGELLDKGAPLQKIVRASIRPNVADSLKTLNKTWEQLKLEPEAGVAFSLISHQNVLELPNGFNQSGAADILSSVPEIKIAVIFVEKTPGIFSCSLRSQKNRGVDVARIARRFGGGGHTLAAAFQSSRPPEEIMAEIKGLVNPTHQKAADSCQRMNG